MKKYVPGIFFNVFGVIATFLVAVAAPATLADSLRDAQRLLQVTDAADKFDLATRNQTADIVRTYSLIVSMRTDASLPDTIKKQIADCYFRTYTWERFEPGIARIFAENLSETDLQLLLDFANDLSVPPMRIAQFKNLSDKAKVIEQQSIEYIFSNSEGCDERNVDLILTYLAEF